MNEIELRSPLVVRSEAEIKTENEKQKAERLAFLRVFKTSDYVIPIIDGCKTTIRKIESDYIMIKLLFENSHQQETPLFGDTARMIWSKAIIQL